MISNLGKALGILIRHEAQEACMHADVDAWGAPSECHALVRKGEAKRFRLARRHAEAEAQRPMRVILAEAKQRVTEKSLARATARIMAKYAFPF